MAQSAVVTLAEELRQARSRAGLTLKQLERHTHASDSSLARYLAGKLLPPWPLVETLCRLSDRDPLELRPLWERADQERRTRPSGATALNHLPAAAVDFTGRAALVKALTAGRAGTVDVIDGMAGMGKTTLAVHLGHRLAEKYPDGQFYVDLHGFTPGRALVDPTSALGTLLRQAGVPDAAIPEDPTMVAGLWRARLADRRAVVVLDNAADEAQVRPLLVGTPSCRTLITSRRRLAGLDGVRPVSLEPLSDVEAVELFDRSLGGARAAAEPEATAEVLRLCGRLPLAIRLAAARLRHRTTWDVAYLADLLRDEHLGLAVLDVGDRSVAGAFAVSQQRLATDQRQVFGLLGLIPGDDVDAHAVAALADLPLHRAASALEDLTDAHLVEQRARGRYQLHDLVRQHTRAAAETNLSQADRDGAVHRLLDYYAAATTAAANRLPNRDWRMAFPVDRPPATLPTLNSPQTALRWLDTERANLVAAITTGPDRHACTLAQALVPYFRARVQHHHDIVTVTLAGEAAARRLGDASARATLMRHRAGGQVNTFAAAHAVALAREALDLVRTTDDRRAELYILHLIGYAIETTDDFTAALVPLQEAVDLYRALDSADNGPIPLATLSRALLGLGRLDEADAVAAEAVTLAEAGDYPYVTAVAQLTFGRVALARKQPAEALGHFEEAFTRARELDHQLIELNAVFGLAVSHRELGDPPTSLGYHDATESLAKDLQMGTAMAAMILSRAETLRHFDRRAEARACYEEAIVHYAAGDRPDILTWVRGELAALDTE
ncbi:helix-turn-helix domain-containing protein [Longispora sp. NPDC051575]|uniref:ATP-binding protein n=1 Tax=Longispora sp. NPDC051575 TaxID=3154943 RepID=UPI003428EB8A